MIRQIPRRAMPPCVAWLVLVVLGGCAEKSVRPGINDEFKDPDLAKWTQRFEAESREIYSERDKIADACKLVPGMAVADIGAGTGFFTFLFADRVGTGGKVYAVDISPKFLQHIDETAGKDGRANITTVLAAQRSVELPPESIDVAFLCDTYHHFEYPHSTLRSIHRALRPSGRLIVVDFEREIGKSRDWVLEHVRAGREVVTREICAERFELIDQPATPWLKENYILRFRKAG